VDQNVNVEFALFDRQSRNIIDRKEIITADQSDLETANRQYELINIADTIFIEFSANDCDFGADTSEIIEFGLYTDITGTKDLMDFAGLEVVSENTADLVGLIRNVQISNDEDEHRRKVTNGTAQNDRHRLPGWTTRKVRKEKWINI
jgi:hypothetical protein